MSINWQWVANKSLGPIVIGSCISEYVESLGVVCDESPNDSTGWDTYIIPNNEIYIDVSNGRVVSITAYLEFMYGEKNIIGMTMAQIEKILGCEPDEIGDSVEYDDGDVKTPFDYFDLGLQLWASDGVVTSATCVLYEEQLGSKTKGTHLP